MFRNREELATSPDRELALDCLEAGIQAAQPETVIEEQVHLEDGTLVVDGERFDLDGVDRLLVVGGGNAAGTAAAALESVLGDRIADGVVVTDTPTDCDRIQMYEGTHPVPEERNVEATARLLELTDSATADDLVLAVVTGGGSALMAAPADGVTLDDLRTTTEALLQSGAAIDEINAVRKHLSAVKGGQLARTGAPAEVRGLVFSDVVGDELDTVASGPTAPDETTYDDALAVLDRHDVDVPDAVRERLEAGTRGDGQETPGADDSIFERVSNHVLANGLTALDAAAERASESGYAPLILSSRVRGEASESAKTHVAIAEECRASGNPVEPPAVLLSGGETTVTNPGDGTGGPNQEFALSAAIELQDSAVVASVDTDGIDGSTTVAGGLVDAETVVDEDAALTALRDHESYAALHERGATVETGPTGTNVNDLRVLVVS